MVVALVLILALALEVEPNHSTVIPAFLADDVSIGIGLWTKAGRPLPPAEEDER